MSYRNDHDAAIARVDALEVELAILRRAGEKTRDAEEPPPKRRPGAGWMIIAAIGLGLGFGLATKKPDKAPAPAPAAAPAPAPAVVLAPPITSGDLDLVRTCHHATKSLPKQRTAESTDPHGAHEDVAPIAKTSAGCRQLLAASNSLAIDPTLRPLVAKWSAAEDELAGCISRTLVYYGGDPYATNNYATAPQLWKEYDRAITARDAVLEQLAPKL